MIRADRLLASTLAIVLTLSAGALVANAAGDWAKGKEIFQKKGSNDKSCNDCHPKGKTNGKKLKGKKVPNLMSEVAEEPVDKITKKTKKHLEKDVGLTLTPQEFDDLMAFVFALPTKGWDG